MTRRDRALILATLAAALALSRFWALDADPPGWMPGAFLVDSGWWASGARGIFLFGDPLADDFGMAALLLPGYTWTLAAIYALFGVDLLGAEALAAASSLATIALVCLLLGRKAGWNAALWAALLLGASPFYWAHGRAALPESLQAFFVFLGAFVWVRGSGAGAQAAWRCRPAPAFLAGLAWGGAVAVKMNALTLGLMPLLVVGVVLLWREARSAAGAEPRRSSLSTLPSATRGWIPPLTLAALGMAVAGGAAFLPLALPHWDQFTEVLHTESSTRDLSWLRRMTFPGYALISDSLGVDANVPVFWKVAQWSPAILLGFWSYGLRWVAGRARPDTFEFGLLAWALAAWGAVLLGLNQWEYRYILVLPLFAMLVAVHASGCVGAAPLARERQAAGSPPPLRGHSQSAVRGYLLGILAWGILLFPLFLLVKPWATRLVSSIPFPVVGGGEVRYLGTGGAGTPVVLGWLLLLAALAPLAGKARRLARRLARIPAPLVLAPLLALEAGYVAVQLAEARAGLREELPALHRRVEPGEIVAGRLSATLFHSAPVHAMRCGSVEDDPDFFDWPRVRDRLAPRYVVLIAEAEGAPEMDFPQLASELAADGYVEIYRFHAGRHRGRTPRHAFALFEFRARAPDSPQE